MLLQKHTQHPDLDVPADVEVNGPSGGREEFMGERTNASFAPTREAVRGRGG